MDRGGPGDGLGRPGNGPDIEVVIERTVARIVEILTPVQRTKWSELIGEPFGYRLRG